MLTASVSNIELYRCWRDDKELGLDWILQRILHPEQTEAMKAGEALHKSLELIGPSETDTIVSGEYTFTFDCDCVVDVAPMRELRVQKAYSNLWVRGRVDDISGKRVTDYKTTARFDIERLMEGYQWRYYLDMLDADLFRWIAFVMDETAEPKHYLVRDVQTLEQRRYPDLLADCERLAADYVQFAEEHLIPAQKGGWLPLTKAV
jgi:hypothetical protein